jgi:hypothetical protein
MPIQAMELDSEVYTAVGCCTTSIQTNVSIYRSMTGSDRFRLIPSAIE